MERHLVGVYNVVPSSQKKMGIILKKNIKMNKQKRMNEMKEDTFS